MMITCPHCGFAKQIDPERIPERPLRITCPSCGARFRLEKEAPTEGVDTAHLMPDEGMAEDGVAASTEAPSLVAGNGERDQSTSVPQEVTPTLRCSACGLEQSVGKRCRGCGAVFTATAAISAHAYAGFWIRFVAAMIDSVLVTVVQIVLGIALGIAVGMLGGLGGNDMTIAFTTWLFGTALAVAYYIVFTGHGGQTPGKMALRIKVICTDGAEIGYGKAALREVPGKFISGILLGIGYLMVAFDSRKQGLHDKIAGTYVIKL